MPNVNNVNNLDLELYELLKDREIFSDAYGFYFVEKEYGFKIYITGERKYSIEKIKEILEKQ
jgi:hypothetical protein